MNKTLTAPKQLRGTLTLPPDKSICQRLAIFSLLRNGETRISGYSAAADPQSALMAVKQLGAQVEQQKDEDGNYNVRIVSNGKDALKQLPPVRLDCGNSGTAMRLLSGVVAGAGIEAELFGDASLSSRTMKRIIVPLRQMGARIEARDDDFAPLKFSPHEGLKALEYVLPVPSAQLKSCLLLAGMFSAEPTKIGELAISRDHTERMLALPKIAAEKPLLHWLQASEHQSVPDLSGAVPADFSAAAFWLVAGLIHSDADILLKKVGMNPTRNAALEVLKRMGGHIEVSELASEGEPLADIRVKSSRLQATAVLEEEIAILIDELPVLAVAMAVAEGKSEVRGAEELRHKETDRIAAIGHLLDAAGVEHQLFDDGFVVNGSPNHVFESAIFNSFHDHRIAMSAAILSLRSTQSIEILEAEAASVSYPRFYEHLQKISLV